MLKSIHLCPDSAVPLDRQLHTHLAARIRAGEIPKGKRLPSIRSVAGHLDVPRKTVATAYASLEADGLIRTDPDTGPRVALEPPSPHLGDARRLYCLYRLLQYCQRKRLPQAATVRAELVKAWRAYQAHRPGLAPRSPALDWPHVGDEALLKRRNAHAAIPQREDCTCHHCQRLSQAW